VVAVEREGGGDFSLGGMTSTTLIGEIGVTGVGRGDLLRHVRRRLDVLICCLIFCGVKSI